MAIRAARTIEALKRLTLSQFQPVPAGGGGGSGAFAGGQARADDWRQDRGQGGMEWEESEPCVTALALG